MPSLSKSRFARPARVLAWGRKTKWVPTHLEGKSNYLKRDNTALKDPLSINRKSNKERLGVEGGLKILNFPGSPGERWCFYAAPELRNNSGGEGPPPSNCETLLTENKFPWDCNYNPGLVSVTGDVCLASVGHNGIRGLSETSVQWRISHCVCDLQLSWLRHHLRYKTTPCNRLRRILLLE